jgi:hypothetical protein
VHDQAWSWVGEDGVEHRGSENQLTDALATGRLAPYTLVTKPEWRDWLPAMTVVELQWALPAGTADNPRRPLPRENLPKLPPPLGDYALFRQRHLNLLQFSQSPPPEMPSSSGRSLPKYTSDDYDEPTVQIDAEELERALSESRGDDGTLKRGKDSALARLSTAKRSGAEPNEAALENQNNAPLVSKPLNRVALAQRLAHKMPTHPGFAPHTAPPLQPPPLSPPPRVAHSQPPSPHGPLSPAPSGIKSAPISSQPGPLAFDSQPSHALAGQSQFPPLNKPVDTSGGFGGHEPTLSSRLDSVLPPARSYGSGNRRKAAWFLGLLVLGAVAGTFIFRTQSPAPAPSGAASTAATAAPPIPSAKAETPHVKSCEVGKQAKISDYAHAPVRPATSSTPGSNNIAIGFAQSGKIAAGLTVDPVNLAASSLYSETQNSPVWSVTPTSVGDALKFQTSRAASTLRSTTTLPGAHPLVVGLNREHIAGRTSADVVDRLIWKSDWDTISTPDWIQLDPTTFVVAFRGGGERGDVVVGKLSDAGKPLGSLVLVKSPQPRVEAPFITQQDKRVLVTFAAGDKPLRDRVLVATSTQDSLPTEATELLTVAEGVTSPQLVPLLPAGFGLQYTRGVAGKQQVFLQLFSPELRAVGEPFVLSPAGKDAYEGYAFRSGQQAFVLYFVRQPLGHELWLTRIACQQP